MMGEGRMQNTPRSRSKTSGKKNITVSSLTKENTNRSEREFGRTGGPPSTRRRTTTPPLGIRIPNNNNPIFEIPLHTSGGTVYAIANPGAPKPSSNTTGTEQQKEEDGWALLGEQVRKQQLEEEARREAARRNKAFSITFVGVLLLALTLIEYMYDSPIFRYVGLLPKSMSPFVSSNASLLYT